MPLQNDGIFVSAVSLSSSEKDDNTKMLIGQAVAMLNTASETVEPLRLKMHKVASTLPESPASFTAESASFPRPRRTPGHAPRAPSWVCTGK